MENEILLSIICPAYNAEKTIGKLIESIVLQRYDNYELIILNDGSTDKTWEVIQKYSKKYKKIISINKLNTGVGDTRNEGLKIAKGKYITFADSDDFYTQDFFKKIIPEIEKNDFELLFFNAHVMNYETNMHCLIPNKYSEGKFIEENGVIKYLNGEFCHRVGNVPWNKIYVARIIRDNNLIYEKDKKRGQDLLFNILYVSKINKYKYVNEKIYFYQLNMNTITTTIYRNMKIKETIKFYKPIKKICIENNIDDYVQYIGLFFLRRFIGVVLNETNNSDYKSGKKNIKEYLTNKELENVFKKIRFKNFDFKLFCCYMIYKLGIYRSMYYIMWHRKHK